MLVFERILAVFDAYVAFGVVFGLAFVAVGIHRIDPIARGSSLGFRAAVFSRRRRVLVPAAAALGARRPGGSAGTDCASRRSVT